MDQQREAIKQRDEWQLDQEKQARNYEIAGFDVEMEALNRIKNPDFYEEEQKEMEASLTKRGEEKLEEFKSAQPLAKIGPATRLTLEQAKSRSIEIKKFCKEILKEDIDFGEIPGTKKKVLLKPGAEKICQFLMLRPEFTPIKTIEDFQQPLFFYRYRCELYHIGTGELVGSGIGSCNSMESSYRWRTSKQKCPACEGEFIFKSKYADKKTGDKGFYCYAAKGGCGAQYVSTDPAIIDQKVGKVANPDICDQVNTIDKMAQKRALLAPVLIVSGLSDEFTQDIDPPKDPTSNPPPQSNPPKTQKAAPPTQGNLSVETELRARAKIEILEVCEQLVKREIYSDAESALMEIMDNPEVTFDHIEKYTTHPKHLKVVAGITKGLKLLNPEDK